MKVGIIDYGLCNLHSISSAIKHLKYDYQFINNPQNIDKYEKIILPGVGAFSDGMTGLREKDFVKNLCGYVHEGGHFLGICLGMQMMLSKSHEFGTHKGLNLIEGEVIKIPSEVNSKTHKIPHLGWNKLIITNNKTNQITKENHYVYFVHSYMVKCSSQYIHANTNYNSLSMPAIINYKNSYGCQFHPEKSGQVGLSIIQNFINL